MASANPPLSIVVDSREQRPYGFEKYQAQTVPGTLATGDYSLVGLEARVAVERKSLSDLVACLGRDRERFERELRRAAALDRFAVVVEASMEDVARGRYRSRIKPHSALQSVLAFQVRYGTPFIWAGSREGGEYCAYWFLQKYLRSSEEQVSAQKYSTQKRLGPPNQFQNLGHEYSFRN
ncbi:MAG TPA: ERCC4 domain-containing protein [Desulfovibrio sp.]|jgi:ERCC4-type nuclease|uniref:ERCC4 domain-containing protein n=1 Tax=Desulfovibrio sp. TaxID=885 RepID=UPI002B6807E3|nr:ERCC4 domain-containing protein [Desulfovibrio sp.]HMM37905.1 ERCC4 domain-containing protein [Desulfovibrio sp.]